MRRRLAAALGLVLLAVACAGGGVAVEDPVPTVFADEPAEDAVPPPGDRVPPTTTTLPIADRLPSLAEEVPGAVRSSTGALLAIQGTDGNSWVVTDPCEGSTLLEAAEARVVGPHHVVLDPGHGGQDRGALGPGGLEEAELNLDIAQRTAIVLEQHGVTVVLTRETDTDLSATARAAAPAAVGALAMVSIHHGDRGEESVSGPGTEAWYRIDDPGSRRLAGLVYEEVSGALAGFDVQWWAPPEPGVKYLLNQRGEDYHTVLRASAATPGVLVELAVMTNPDEAALLATEEGRRAEARALADALMRFLVDDDEGRGFIEPTERVRTAEPAGGGCP